MVSKTRIETGEFVKNLENGDVRWEKILRLRSPRQGSEFDTFESALGLHRLREGFVLFWYRSSQKRMRDADDRKDRITRAWEKLESLNLNRVRGPKTEQTLKKRINAILSRYHIQDWLTVEIKLDIEEKYKATTRGKPTPETRYRKLIRKVPRLHIKKNVEAIACAQMMDGIFPLATNTNRKPIEILKIYKYQPKLEKRHSLLKTTLAVAPIWLKKNTRIEALMFVEYLAQMVAALIERELRQKMQGRYIKGIPLLPEGRMSQTPTFEQVLRLFENHSRHDLFEKNWLIRSFSKPISPVQSKILSLLKIPVSAYTAQT